MKKTDFFPEGITYLNTAGDGLFSKENYKKLDHLRSLFQSNLTEHRLKFITEDEDRIRQKASEFVHCNANEMCLTKSFSVGFNFLLPSLTEYKKVLLLENDYPSIWVPLGLRDREIFTVPKNSENTFKAERIIEYAEEVQPQMIALSHVQYGTGYLADIKAIGDYCKSKDIIFLVDGTQALGCVPLNFSEMHVDVYIASTYKWLCAGYGSGLMYINKECQKKLHYKTGGFLAWFESGDEWKTKQSLTYLEAGHKDHEAFYRLELGLEDAAERSNVLEHNRGLILKLKALLKSHDIEIISDYSEEETSGILVAKDPGGLFEKLKENKIYATTRNGNIRFSCHFYNDEEDLRKLDTLLSKLI